MREQASRLGAGTLTRYAEVVHAGLGEMRGATAPGCCSRWCAPGYCCRRPATPNGPCCNGSNTSRRGWTFPFPAGEAAASSACHTAEAIRPQEQGGRTAPAKRTEPASTADPHPGRSHLRPSRGPRQPNQRPNRRLPRRRCCRRRTPWWTLQRRLHLLWLANPMRPRCAACGPRCGTRFASAAAQPR